MSGQERVVRFLMRRGADVKVKGGQFGSVLQAACFNCSKKFVDFLIHKGVDINAQGGRYRTALQAAAAAGRQAIVQTLLAQKANPNVIGGKYGSALQAACASGRLNIVKMLVEHGADVTIIGGMHGTALQAAAVNGHSDVAHYIVTSLDIAEATIDRKLNCKKPKKIGRANEVLKKALEPVLQLKPEPEPAPSFNEAVFPDQLNASEKDNCNQEEEREELPMNVDAIPEYNPSTAPPEAEGPGLDETASSGASSATDSEARGESPTSSVEDANADSPPYTEPAPAADETEAAKLEDMSALDWCQVECGYGGDLSGPGR